MLSMVANGQTPKSRIHKERCAHVYCDLAHKTFRSRTVGSRLPSAIIAPIMVSQLLLLVYRFENE